MGADGTLILLPDQDRERWDRNKIDDGERLLEAALRARRPGPYQLHAAIAACHSCAPTAAATDWRQIAALYGQLIRYEPGPVTAANRAVAVAMAEGAAAGLAILDAAGTHPHMARWPPFHIARAELLRRAGREAEAAEAFRAALRLDLPPAERTFIESRITQPGTGGPGAPASKPHRLRRDDRYRPSDPRPQAWVSGRCVGEVPPRGAERMRGVRRVAPPG